MTEVARHAPEAQRHGQWRRDDVRERLAELVNGLPDGARLPAERDLAETLTVSRTTVRQATQELVAAGRLARRHGSGTYVCGPKVTFLLEPGAQGSVVGPRDAMLNVRRSRSRGVPAGVAGQLDLPDGVGVLTVRRTWLVADSPLAVEHSHLPDPDGGVVSITGAPDTARHVDTAIEHRPSTTQEAAELSVRQGTPVFTAQRTYYDEDDRVVAVSALVVRADRCSLLLRSATR